MVPNSHKLVEGETRTIINPIGSLCDITYVYKNGRVWQRNPSYNIHQLYGPLIWIETMRQEQLRKLMEHGNSP